MSSIALIVPKGGGRRWHEVLAKRLTEQGHQVAFFAGGNDDAQYWLDATLAIETWALGLGSDSLARRINDLEIDDLEIEPGAAATPTNHDIVIDLTAPPQARTDRALYLFSDCGDLLADPATALAQGVSPTIQIIQNGQRVAEAAPMIDTQYSIAKGLNNVLARAISLTEKTVREIMTGTLKPHAAIASSLAMASSWPTVRAAGFARAHMRHALPRIAREISRRRRYHHAHWRIGYRRRDAGTIIKTHDLSGPSWHMVRDDGRRFFADPFAFIRAGKTYIFVEDFSHEMGKGRISVIEIGADGHPSPATIVLEEAHHLSYPQVFDMDGEIWMIPESNTNEEVALYRADQFPHRWSRYARLVAGRALSDATLLCHGGTYWLFATDRDGLGSSSDLMVVYHAHHLSGPWAPHPANPIIIDRRRARPGGGFVRHDGRLFLPLQDGSRGYGGGLGLAELRHLDTTRVDFAAPIPIANNSDWPHSAIHTYNRAGDMEVIDGRVDMRR